jgi:enamine deaminase RidA (YjgF/YER057c/UK114 family)
MASRLTRLATPALVLAAFWLPAMALLAATGAPGGARRAVWSLVSHPLWFLLVYLLLTALTLFTLALAAAQAGAFLLLRPWLARLLRRPAAWAPVAALNLGAMTLYCWHQTALLLVTFAGLPFGTLPGCSTRRPATGPCTGCPGCRLRPRPGRSVRAVPPLRDPQGDRVLIERRLAELGLELPEPMTPPPGAELPFPWVRVWNGRAFVSGHGPLMPDGSMPEVLGKVGAEVSEEDAYLAARSTALAILASLRRELGDLDRVTAWLRVFGMVNTAPGFTRTPLVINGFSDLILELWGPEAGAHSRSAVGMAELPFRIPVEIEAEVAID